MTDAWDGRPQNPERDGWHWFEFNAAAGEFYADLWNAEVGRWEEGGSAKYSSWRCYVGPCLTPAEVEARVAAARREGIEAAAGEVDCGCDIRDAVLARLEDKGEKYASYLCSHNCSTLQAAAIRALLTEGKR